MNECNFFFHGKLHKNYYDNLWRKYYYHKEKKNENNLFCPKEIALEYHNRII